MQIKIKPLYAARKVAFKGSQGKRLGELTEEQLVPLAIIAQQSNDPTLIRLFEPGLPPLSDLQKGITGKSVSNIPIKSSTLVKPSTSAISKKTENPK